MKRKRPKNENEEDKIAHVGKQRRHANDCLEAHTRKMMDAIESHMLKFQKDLLWCISRDYGLCHDALLRDYCEPAFLLQQEEEAPPEPRRAHREPSPFFLEHATSSRKDDVYTDHTIPMRQRLQTVVESFSLG